MEKQGVFKKSIGGGKWMLAGTITQRILSIASFLILARLLTPEDFGVMAIILIIPPLLDLLFTIDFESAIIQRQIEPRNYFDTIWTINVIRSGFIFLLIFFAGPWVASFFNAESATLAIRMGGLFVFISGFSNVAQIIFFKELDFKKIFIRDVVSRTAYTVTAIGFAWYLKSFWALFLANIVLYATSLIVVYVLLPYRPHFSFSIKKLKTLLTYSKWLYGQGIFGEFASTVENSIIGKLLGAGDLGLFTRAKALAITPTAPLVSIVSKVSFPAYTRIQESTEKVKDGFLKSMDVLFFFAIPFPFLAILGGERLIQIVLGTSWVVLTPLFQILSLSMIFQIIAILSGPLFNALGHPNIQLKISIIQFILLIAFLLTLTPLYSAIGAALGILTTSVIVSITVLWSIKKILDAPWKDFLSPLIIPLVSSLVAMGIFYYIFQKETIISDILFLFLLIFFGLIYLGMVWLFDATIARGPYQTFRSVARELIQR